MTTTKCRAISALLDECSGSATQMLTDETRNRSGRGGPEGALVRDAFASAIARAKGLVASRSLLDATAIPKAADLILDQPRRSSIVSKADRAAAVAALGWLTSNPAIRAETAMAAAEILERRKP